MVHRAIVSGHSSPYTEFDQEIIRRFKSSHAIDYVVAGLNGNCTKGQKSALLPMAFPEGSPTHPAYGAGHATVAGACVTILKSFFDGRVQFIGPVEPSADGQTLVPYHGMDAHCQKMTVELELNKLAANIAIGRNMAGVHWRSDYTQSVLLGQRIAVDMLYRQSANYCEDYSMVFNSFGGKEIRVSPGRVEYNGADLGLPELSRGESVLAHNCEIANYLMQIV